MVPATFAEWEIVHEFETNRWTLRRSREGSNEPVTERGAITSIFWKAGYAFMQTTALNPDTQVQCWCYLHCN